MKEKQPIPLPVKAILFLPAIIALLAINLWAGGGSGPPWNQSDDPADDGSIYQMPAYVEGEVMVKLESPDSLLMEDINAQFATATRRFFPQLGIFLLDIGEQDISMLIYNLKQLPDVTWAKPNFEVIPLQSVQGSFALPDEADQGSYLDQPAATMLNLPDVHQLYTGDNIRVAVIDGGVDYDHPAFEGAVISGFDYVDNDPEAYDEPGGDNSGHGTFIAGVIHLMAPDAEIISYRVSDVDGNSDGNLVAEAILQAIQDDCQIINLSLVTTGRHETMASAIKFAKSFNILVIAAAGNGQHETELYPACDPYVIGVGAIDENSIPADFSYAAEYIDIYAPGVDIYCPYQDNGYAWWSGTSFAAPFVTGQAALIYSTNVPDYVARNWVVEAISSTVSSLGGEYGDGFTTTGGIINPLASLLLEPPMFALIIDLWNRGEVIQVQREVSGSWDQQILVGATSDDFDIPYTVEISPSASFIKSYNCDREFVPSHVYFHMDPDGLSNGYYQDTVFINVEGAYNNPVMHIYTLHVSDDPLPIHSYFSCTDSVWNLYCGQYWPYYCSFAIQAYQKFNLNYFPVEAPYTIWQDANPEFVVLEASEGADGITPDGYHFDINVANSLPEGVYYDTVFASVEGSVDTVIFQPFELHITEGDSMWIDVVGDLPEGAYAVDDIINHHYHIYFGDIEINSTRIDTFFLSINYTGVPSDYTLDIYMKEYMDDTSSYNFIDIPRSGVTIDTIRVIMDWSGHTHTSTGSYLRWYKVEIPDAINGFRVLNFNFDVVENSQAPSIPENPGIAYGISNYPNPFNPATNFDFSLPKAGHVRLEIYNMLGQKVGTPTDQFYEAGTHSVEWNGSNFASGIYFYKITAGEFTETKKMLLVK